MTASRAGATDCPGPGDTPHRVPSPSKDTSPVPGQPSLTEFVTRGMAAQRAAADAARAAADPVLTAIASDPHRHAELVQCLAIAEIALRQARRIVCDAAPVSYAHKMTQAGLQKFDADFALREKLEPHLNEIRFEATITHGTIIR